MQYCRLLNNAKFPAEHASRAISAIYGGVKRDKASLGAEGAPKPYRGIHCLQAGVTQNEDMALSAMSCCLWVRQAKWSIDLMARVLEKRQGWLLKIHLVHFLSCQMGVHSVKIKSFPCSIRISHTEELYIQKEI
jgi:hypothetical protein